MHQVSATYRNGQVILDSPVDWPDGTPVVVNPAPTAAAQISVEEFDRLLDELADIGEATIDPSTPPLSDRDLSRQGIYGDHP